MKYNQMLLASLWDQVVDVKLFFSSPNKQRCERTRQQIHAMGNCVRMTAFWQLPLILQKHMSERDFYLVCGEETSWAGMLPVTESYSFILA